MLLCYLDRMCIFYKLFNANININVGFILKTNQNSCIAASCLIDLVRLAFWPLKCNMNKNHLCNCNVVLLILNMFMFIYSTVTYATMVLLYSIEEARISNLVECQVEKMCL